MKVEINEKYSNEDLASCVGVPTGRKCQYGYSS